jgi:hypothetical protein
MRRSEVRRFTVLGCLVLVGNLLVACSPHYLSAADAFQPILPSRQQHHVVPLFSQPPQQKRTSPPPRSNSPPPRSNSTPNRRQQQQNNGYQSPRNTNGGRRNSNRRQGSNATQQSIDLDAYFASKLAEMHDRTSRGANLTRKFYLWTEPCYSACLQIHRYLSNLFRSPTLTYF